MIEYIGIDLGGTNIRVGAMDELENIIFECKEPTFKDVTNGEELCDKMIRIIKKVPNYKDAKAIGIGVPGAVNGKSGRMISSKNVSELIDFPLVENLNKEFNKPIYIENDAKVAAFAEALVGRGKNKNIVCYITISTGLGGGIVMNKKIYRGANNLGGYFSRIILDGNSTSDSLISGRALYKQAKERINANIKNTEELFDLYKNGNDSAREIIEKFKLNLVTLLLNVSSIINPDIIIFGGGVLKSKEYYLDAVKEEFKNRVHLLAKSTIVDVAEYEEPGIIGACLIAKYY